PIATCFHMNASEVRNPPAGTHVGKLCWLVATVFQSPRRTICQREDHQQKEPLRRNMQGCAVREIRMLRAMWRELETELRNDLYGYEWGKPVIMLAQSESDVPIDLKDAAMASVRPRTT
ncbi:MAG: hypothetical protein WBN00_14795, partial [Sedimenticolaceae bacterium]